MPSDLRQTNPVGTCLHEIGRPSLDGASARRLQNASTALLAVAPLLLALLLNFGLRYIHLFTRAGFQSAVEAIGGDAGDYLEKAYTISELHAFGSPIDFDVKQALITKQRPPIHTDRIQADAVRPPLWPSVLAVLMKLSTYDLRHMFYGRCLLDSVTVVLFYQILLMLQMSGWARFLALQLFAIHPAWLIYSVTFLSEPFTLLLHVALGLSLLKLTAAWSPWRAGVVGAIGGLVILEHPYYVFLPFTFLAIFTLAKRIPPRRAACIACLSALIVTPWLIRNMMLFKSSVPILTASFGKLLARGWNPNFLELYRNTTGDLMRVEASSNADLTLLNQQQRSAAYQRAAVDFIRTDWRVVPAIVARKLVGAVTPVPETPRHGILEWGRTLYQICSILAVTLLIWRGWGGHGRLLVIGAYSAYLIMSVLTVPTIRYRFPLVWVEVIGIAIACNSVAGKLLSSTGTRSEREAPGYPARTAKLQPGGETP
jgi:hypothetical protein